jgi:hypothetical protein
LELACGRVTPRCETAPVVLLVLRIREMRRALCWGYETARTRCDPGCDDCKFADGSTPKDWSPSAESGGSRKLDCNGPVWPARQATMKQISMSSQFLAGAAKRSCLQDRDVGPTGRIPRASLFQPRPHRLHRSEGYGSPLRTKSGVSLTSSTDLNCSRSDWSFSFSAPRLLSQIRDRGRWLQELFPARFEFTANTQDLCVLRVDNTRLVG